MLVRALRGRRRSQRSARVLRRRLTLEVLRSPGIERVHLVHPTHARRARPAVRPVARRRAGAGRPGHAAASRTRRSRPAGAGAGRAATRGAVIFGPASGFKDDVRRRPPATWRWCGGGCMGFVNTVTRRPGDRLHGARPDCRPDPIALVTHSGSVFSAMLRTHRALDYTLVVSSGQELVTTTSDYLALRPLPATRRAWSGCSSRRCATPTGLQAGLAEAAERDIPVVRPDRRRSPTRAGHGRRPLRRHSPAVGRRLGGAVHGVRRAPRAATSTSSPTPSSCSRSGGGSASAGAGRGIATVHDSGGERALVADAGRAPRRDRSRRWPTTTRERLAGAPRPGPGADQPARRVGHRRRHRGRSSPSAWRRSPTTPRWTPSRCRRPGRRVRRRRGATRAAWSRCWRAPTSRSSCSATSRRQLDQAQAAELRALGIPVLEGTYSGSPRARPPARRRDAASRGRPWPSTRTGVTLARAARDRRALDAAESASLLRDYGIAPSRRAGRDDAERPSPRPTSSATPWCSRPPHPASSTRPTSDGVRLGLADAGGRRVGVRRSRAAGSDPTSCRAAAAHRRRRARARVRARSAARAARAASRSAAPWSRSSPSARVALPPLTASTADAMIGRLASSRPCSPASAGARRATWRGRRCAGRARPARGRARRPPRGSRRQPVDLSARRRRCRRRPGPPR